MVRARIDKISSFGGLAINIVGILLYLVFAEFVFYFTILKDINTDTDYYVSQNFHGQELEDALQFKKDLDSLGERAVIVPGTTIYKYKPAKTKSFTINSFGFRGEEFTNKKDDEYRIVFFGNSKILGPMLPEKDTIPVLVQEKLREHFKNEKKKITVFNFGIEAFNIQRAIEAAKLYHSNLEADFVVFYSVVIDVNEAYSMGAYDVKPFVEGDNVPEIFRAQNNGWHLIKLKLLYILRAALLSDMYKFEMNGAQRDVMTIPIPPVQLHFMNAFPPAYAARIKEISDYFKKYNINSLIVMPPLIQTKSSLSESEKNLMFQREILAPGVNHFTRDCYLKTIDEVMRLADVNAVDHSGIFNGIKETVFYDGLHMTPGMSRMSAEKISADLIKIIESEHCLDQK